MSDNYIDPFTNIPLVPVGEATNDNQGGTFLSDLRELSVGDGGANVFHANKEGIWLGSDRFATAPFRVDMLGNCVANSITLSGFIAVGGAAADVNANVTTISGGKITTNSIDANKIVTNSLVVGTNVLIGSALGAGMAASDVNSNTTTINGGKITTNTIDANKIISNSLIVGTNVLIGSALGAGQAANDINSNTTTISGGKITTNSIDANKIIAVSLSAVQANVSYLSAIRSDMGTITAGVFKVSSYIGVQKSNGTPVAYLGQDPNSAGIWGLMTERGYGLMCRYSGANYFRIYMDSGSTDAVIDMPSPNKIKIQDNEGNAIVRFYGRNAGFSGVGGMDMFGALRLYTSSTPPSGASNGMMFYHTTWNEVWVFKSGAWKALAYVP